MMFLTLCFYALSPQITICGAFLPHRAGDGSLQCGDESIVLGLFFEVLLRISLQNEIISPLGNSYSAITLPATLSSLVNALETDKAIFNMYKSI
jgi:hypothetical protein